MKFPSKVTPFKESILYKCFLVLENSPQKISLKKLYEINKNEMNIEDFLDSISILKLLGKIKLVEDEVYKC